jgi:hypothetical protein
VYFSELRGNIVAETHSTEPGRRDHALSVVRAINSAFFEALIFSASMSPCLVGRDVCKHCLVKPVWLIQLCSEVGLVEALLITVG